MSFTGGEVIDAARGLDSSFDPQRHPQRVCLEFLTRYQRRLAGKMLQVEAESISSEISISLPLAVFASGAPLVDGSSDPLQFDRLHGFTLVDPQGLEETLPMVPYKDRFTAQRWLYAWLRERTVFLSHTATQWVGYSEIKVSYAPTPVPVATPATDLILPDSSFDTVVLALGGEMAKRKPNETERTTLPGEASDAEKDFLNLLEERNDTEVGTVRRVFS